MRRLSYSMHYFLSAKRMKEKRSYRYQKFFMIVESFVNYMNSMQYYMYLKILYVFKNIIIKNIIKL